LSRHGNKTLYFYIFIKQSNQTLLTLYSLVDFATIQPEIATSHYNLMNSFSFLIFLDMEASPRLSLLKRANEYDKPFARHLDYSS
jgi:hypothetical protein